MEVKEESRLNCLIGVCCPFRRMSRQIVGVKGLLFDSEFFHLIEGVQVY